MHTVCLPQRFNDCHLSARPQRTEMQHLQVHAGLEMQLEIATAMVVWVRQGASPKDLQGPLWCTNSQKSLTNTMRKL